MFAPDGSCWPPRLAGPRTMANSIGENSSPVSWFQISRSSLRSVWKNGCVCCGGQTREICLTDGSPSEWRSRFSVQCLFGRCRDLSFSWYNLVRISSNVRSRSPIGTLRMEKWRKFVWIWKPTGDLLLGSKNWYWKG